VLDLVECGTEHASHITDALKRAKGKTGKEVQQEQQDRMAEITKGSQFDALSRPAQDSAIRRWIALDEEQQVLEGLGSEVRSRLSAICRLDKDVMVTEAVQAVRGDDQFQRFMRKETIRKAFDEVRGDCNYILKYQDDPDVMYVMDKFRRLQAVLRPLDITVSLQELLTDQAGASTSADNLRNLQFARATHWEAVLAAAKAEDETAARIAAEAAVRAYSLKHAPPALLPTTSLEFAGILEGATTTTAVGPSGSDVPANTVNTEVAKSPKSPTQQQKEEYNQLLDSAIPLYERERFETWGAFWKDFCGKITQQLALLLVCFALLYTMKHYGLGPFVVLHADQANVRPISPTLLQENTLEENQKAAADGFATRVEQTTFQLEDHTEF